MAVELDIDLPLAVIFVCADRKELIKKHSDQIREQVTKKGYQVVEEFQALTFPKEENRDKVFIETFAYLFVHRELVSTLFLIAEPVLPEDTLSSSLRSLLRQHLGVDVYYAVDDDENLGQVQEENTEVNSSYGDPDENPGNPNYGDPE